MVSSAYLRLLIFLPAILIPACPSSSLAFHMIYSAYKLNKQGDNIQPWRTPFPIWNQSVVPCPVLTLASWSAYRFLRRQVRWSGIPISFRIFHSLLWSTQSKDLVSAFRDLYSPLLLYLLSTSFITVAIMRMCLSDIQLSENNWPQGPSCCTLKSIPVFALRPCLLWRRKWQPTPVLLPGKFHGWRSLVGYSPWGRKELDTTERLHFMPLKSYSQPLIESSKNAKVGSFLGDTGHLGGWLWLQCSLIDLPIFLELYNKLGCFHLIFLHSSQICTMFWPLSQTSPSPAFAVYLSILSHTVSLLIKSNIFNPSWTETNIVIFSRPVFCLFIVFYVLLPIRM